MTAPEFGPVELAVKDWLKTTSVAEQVTRADGKVDIYLAMPKSSPKPVVLCRLIGGGPVGGGDIPASRYRFQFDVIADSRTVADHIQRLLVSELVWLGQDGPGEVVLGVYLGAARVLNVRWQPDPDSDIPRYIVDALITTVM